MALSKNMATPLALCLEDLDAIPERRFLRCCALPESVPGLRLDHDGAVLAAGSARHGGAVHAVER